MFFSLLERRNSTLNNADYDIEARELVINVYTVVNQLLVVLTVIQCLARNTGVRI